MSETPAWAVERAKEIAESIFVEWQASCARHPDGHPSPIGPIVERYLASALTVPEGHVRLPSGDQSLPWKVIHVASNEVVASFKWGDVAQTYIKRGIEIGGWHEHELRLQQAAESARAGGGA